jgi:triacylglycerol lipase
MGERVMVNIAAIEKDDVKSIPTFRAAYSDRTALLMAKVARRAYEKFDADARALKTFSDSLSEVGLTECTDLVDPDLGTAGFIAAGDDIIIVAFRGTENLLDWRTNVMAKWIVLQGGVRVHTGFFQAYWPIRAKMFTTVQRLLAAKLRPVYITGHSLGGALACMATAELANADDARVRDSIAACYTFGCPRAGDPSFDWYIKVPLYRVTNGVDIVPTVPPAILRYRHVGDTRYFRNSGEAPFRRSPNIFAKVARTIWALRKLFPALVIENIADHSMDVYVGKLHAWAQKNIEESHARRTETADPTISSGVKT